MNDLELKAEAIKRLSEQGRILPSHATMQEICVVLGRAPRVGNPARSIISEFLGLSQEEPKPQHNPRYQPTFRPMAPRMHPRQADIDRAQPPMMTPGGIGNYKQPGGFLPEVWR